MRREDLGFPLLELLMLPIYIFNKLRQIKGVAWTEGDQKDDNMQTTYLIGLLWTYYLE